MTDDRINQAIAKCLEDTLQAMSDRAMRAILNPRIRTGSRMTKNDVLADLASRLGSAVVVAVDCIQQYASKVDDLEEFIRDNDITQKHSADVVETRDIEILQNQVKVLQEQNAELTLQVSNQASIIRSFEDNQTKDRNSLSVLHQSSQRLRDAITTSGKLSVFIDGSERTRKIFSDWSGWIDFQSWAFDHRGSFLPVDPLTFEKEMQALLIASTSLLKKISELPDGYSWNPSLNDHASTSARDCGAAFIELQRAAKHATEFLRDASMMKDWAKTGSDPKTADEQAADRFPPL